MISHDEASELLGAYALDAVEPDEAASIEEHLRACPRCRDELRGHREVVGLLAYAGQEAPEGLWDRVAARINDPGETYEAPAPLAPGRGETEPPSWSRPAPVAAPVPLRRRPRLAGIAGLAAAAAVAIIALLGVQVVRLQHRTDHLSGQISAMAGEPTMAAVHRAESTPGARVVALKPPTGSQTQLEAVVLPGGEGYLYGAKLSPLPPSQTYQLWGVVGTQRISYGVLGSSLPPVMAFRAGSGLQALAVTAEVAGGVVSSTQQPVAVGLLG